MRSSRRYMRTYASSPARRSNQTTLPCFACAGTALLLADVDLDAPVARLVDVVGGRHEKLALAATRGLDLRARNADPDRGSRRSEEHTSELQSQSNLVCRLLLEKKKKKKTE